MNIRRRGLLMIYVLSMSMILVSCGKGENHTESKEGEFSMSDTNKETNISETNEAITEVETNEDDTTVQPRAVIFIDETYRNLKSDIEKSFTVYPGSGNKLNIYVYNQGSNPISFIIYQDGRQSVNKTIEPGKQHTYPYNVVRQTTYRVICDGVNGAIWSASIRARQFEG